MDISARTRSFIVTLLATAGLSVAGTALAGEPGGLQFAAARQRAEATLLQQHPGAQFYKTGTVVTTVHGAELAFGESPVDSAEAFLAKHAGVLGITRDSLAEGSLAADNAHTRGLMPVRDDQGRWTGEFKFTLVSYLQVHDGLPVYGGDVRILAKNEENAPVVLVRSAVRPIGTFRPDQDAVANPQIARAFENAMNRYPGIGNFTAPELVIFAGEEVKTPRPATVAVVFEGTVGNAADEGYAKYRIIADAATGAVIFSESLIHHVDVNGQILGNATTGYKSAECNPEAITGMPYARASIGATTVYADVNGNFTVPYGGAGQVSVTGSLQGRWFEVRTPSSLEPTINATVTPPGPAVITFNEANTDQVRRASVNAYLQANVVRDFTLAAAPSYPTIGTQLAFDVNVAVSGTCNAFYDGVSINFYNSGGGCGNTAFADVVHHEYGHHLVQVAGSGQGAYGEGMGDVMGVLISDQPVLGYGFQNNCNAGIRNANNTCQYSAGSCSTCGTEIHACGQLISGCVWSLRNELVVTNPSDYKTILADLAVNSMPLHSGTSINSEIYVDYVTLDGGVGGPHYCQITEAFADHGLATSAGALAFSFPSGKPALIGQGGGVVGTVEVLGLCGKTPQQNTGKLYIDPENDGTYVQYSMNQVSPNVYELSFPPGTCGDLVRWYVTATATDAGVYSDTGNAPTSFNSAIIGSNETAVFADNFQSSQGWVSTVSGATTGQWERGVPADPFGAAPPTDYDGSGQCYVTDNRVGGSIGAYDIDGGSVFLTSPAMDATGGAEAFLSYARWYDNTGAGSGADPNNDIFVVEVSNNNGGSWVNLETVGPAAQSNGGWYHKTFKLSDTIALSNQMKVRFTASDLGSGSVVEAAVDAVELVLIGCACPSDFNDDGFVTGEDFDEFIAAFEAGDISADFNDDTFVSGDDFDAFVEAFVGGC